MKKFFLVLASQLFVANLLFSQITFEKSYQRLAQEEAAQSVIEDGNGGYIVATGGKYTSASLTRDLGLAHLNAYGDTLWYTVYSMSYHPRVREVRKSQDAYYVMGLADDSSLNQTYMLWLQKFDLAGNPLWLKNYTVFPNQPSSPNGFTFELLSNGNLFCTTGWYNYFIIDSAGTILNATYYPHYRDGNTEFVKRKLFHEDSTFYFIKGYRQVLTVFTSYPKLLKINENADSVGSFITQNIDTLWRNVRIHKRIGKNFLISGSVPFVYPSHTYTTLLDSAGNKIWSKKISFLNDSIFYYSSSASLINGTNVISGFPVNGFGPPKAKAFLYCFNDNGDSLWYKEFRGDTLHKTEFYDVIATSDTGILAIGQILMPDSSRQSYIVKLDADGNLFNPLNLVERQKETYLHLYPNPANDFINIHYLGADKNVALSVCDLLGQTLFTQSLTSQDERIKVNTSLFAKGFYFCNITANGKLLASKKLILIK